MNEEASRGSEQEKRKGRSGSSAERQQMQHHIGPAYGEHARPQVAQERLTGEPCVLYSSA